MIFIRSYKILTQKLDQEWLWILALSGLIPQCLGGPWVL